MFETGDIVVFVTANNPLRIGAVARVTHPRTMDCNVEIIECYKASNYVGTKLGVSNDKLRLHVLSNKNAIRYLKRK